MAMPHKTDIKSLNYNELVQYVESINEKKFRAAQLYSWMHEKLAESYDEMTNISDKLKDTLKEDTLYTSLKIVKMQESRIDGTRKYLFELYDGNLIESVFMKYHHGNSVCFSSQVGCKMGCRFCASTLNGCVRNLSPSEMLDQIYRISRDTNERVSNCSNTSTISNCMASNNYNTKPGKSYKLEYSATFNYSDGRSETITGSTSR